MKRTAISLAAAAVVAMLSAATTSAATTSPNDPYFVQHSQWALTGSAAAINAPGAWSVATGYGVVVGDIDTGADFGNPDLQGKLIPGAQFLNCSGSPSGTGQAAVQDDVGHGSMTTGIVVAATNNGKGIAAVAPDARALIVKVLARTIQNDGNGNPQYAYGSGCDNDIGAGIQWAVDHGAQVLNISIGSDVPLTGSVSNITDAITYAWNHDVAVAVAAGNNALPLSDYSTIMNQALVVGALGPSGSVATYSTRNVGVNLYAPGGDSNNGANEDIQHLVVATSWPDPQFKGGDYASGEGTSFAAPQAAGVLALLRSCGYGGQAAVERVKSIASSHSKHLDAAATLAGVTNCAAAPGSKSSGSGQGATGSQSSGTAAAGAAAQPGAPGSTVPPKTGATPGPTASATGATAQPDQGQAGSSPPPVVSVAGGAGGGGSGSPWLLVTLVAVVLIGAPAAAWLVRAMRPPA